jgi:hypothetical protein
METINRWDLNGDGFIDLVFTQDTNARTETPDAFIYWGGREGGIRVAVSTYVGAAPALLCSKTF